MATLKKRIDWLVSQLQIIGGAETFISASAHRLREIGWDLRLITLVSGGELIDQIRNRGLPVLELGLSKQAILAPIYRLIQLWREDRPALLHTHLYHAGIVGRIAARVTGVQTVVVHQHGPEFSRTRFRSWLDRATSGWITRYIASCQAVSEIIQSREGIPAGQIAVIPNGIDTSDLSDQQKPSPWGVKPGQAAIVCIARLAPEKGHIYLLQALKQLKARGYPFQAVFIGEGSSRESLQEFTRNLGLAETVTFTGFQENPRKWLPSFSLFVLPSNWEGISLALLEAMSARLPVVATKTGGTPEVVEHEVTGLLVNPGDPVALAEAIARILSDPDLGRKMGAAGEKRVQDHFRLDQSIEKLADLYAELLSKKGAAG